MELNPNTHITNTTAINGSLTYPLAQYTDTFFANLLAIVYLLLYESVKAFHTRPMNIVLYYIRPLDCSLIFHIHAHAHTKTHVV